MKLVDIEKFDNSKPQLYSDNNYISIEHDICEKMYEFAGVEAIPIEWIEKKIADIKERPEDDYGISDCHELRTSDVWKWLLDDWRKENGNN